MNHRQRRPVGPPTLAVVGVFLAMLAEPAWAYLDPGTGSMIISAVVGLFATLGLAVKTYWYKIKAFFRHDEQSGTASGESLDDHGDEQGPGPGRSTEN